MQDTWVRVGSEPFDVGCETTRLWTGAPQTGAVATFVGVVRDRNDGAEVSRMTLEHYPGMTEKALFGIVLRARERWELGGVTVIHRVGPLEVGDPIVFVGVASSHRQEAFAACEFIMDWLKTEAPFWKKEATPAGERWVDARESDEAAKARWGSDKPRA